MSVLIYTQNWDGKFKKATFELVSYGAELAKKLGTSTVALSIGEVADDELKKLGNYGANKVVSVKNAKLNQLENGAYASIISATAKKESSDIVVFANNLFGKALAPRVSVKLKAGLVSGVVGLPTSTEPFVVNKKVYSGKAASGVKINSAVKILALSQNSFQIVEAPVSAQIEQADFSLTDNDFKTEVKDVQKATSNKILLGDAEIVVSGGRGMKGPENWGPIDELAALLGAGTACSRPVSDEGWRTHHEHVGQTGKVIAPNLYFACGISGAIQHLAGISSSKVIVAFNKDPEAPIFEAAQYGIVGDVLKILPDLISAIKEFKAEN